MIEIKTIKRWFLKEQFKITNYNILHLLNRIDIDLKKKKEMFKSMVLQIDGGGIKGLVPVINLFVLEEKYGQLNKYFKTLWGTSTGAIITSLIAVGLPMKSILNFYVTLGPKIFKNEFGGLFNIFTDSAYDGKYIETVLKKYIGDVTFNDLYENNIELNIPVVRILEKDTIICNHKNTPDWPVWVAVRASMSAPAYFGPFYWKDGLEYPYAFFDGGTGVYNCTLEKAINNEFYIKGFTTDEFYVYSVGYGKDNNSSASFNKDKRNKIIDKKVKKMKKISQLLWTFNFGRQETIDRQLRHALYLVDEIKLNFNRFDILLPKSLSPMDNTDNINELVKYVQEVIKNQHYLLY
ncbi:MAG: patatin-like phospholipase family protein [bacterium]